ncbi:Uncharacterised protein [Ralstonia mannitolilytica]|jgi:hypothetical protein|uniref:Uncharacterized protein n=1 Tax=Ralstonia mannitolilytica TaxID=105219 RepID=A0AAJ4ZJ88_9RALS|nr:hypothetical protein LMG6866_02377 [Ralstonia mannitolilytica]SUD86851.1 Uncharacterised protein [Ralstonia mannitolilytica]SUD96512.1 Uncharacterised protein [Ralstonia mannitolilytica]HDR9191473.1 hypothetical protein [Burkholderia vietnamiensis]
MSDFLNYTAGLHALEKIGEQGRAIDKQNRALREANDDLHRAKYNEDISRIEADRIKKENNEYKALLSKPFAEIAAKDGRFKENYEKQQELLAAWIVSQRAFKEVAMKYGQAMGKSSEEVLSEFQAAKETVLNDQSNFGNTVDETEKKAYKRYLDKEQG